MNRNDFIKRFADEICDEERTQKDGMTSAQTIFETLTDLLLEGQHLEVRGFGTLYVKDYTRDRKYRNPKTGASHYKDSNYKTVKFKTSKMLLERLNAKI